MKKAAKGFLKLDDVKIEKTGFRCCKKAIYIGWKNIANSK